MEDVKHWFLSKTVVAAALGVIITVLQAFGVDQVIGIDKDGVAQNVVNITEGLLYLVALYGRLTAKHALT